MSNCLSLTEATKLQVIGKINKRRDGNGDIDKKNILLSYGYKLISKRQQMFGGDKTRILLLL